MSQRSSDVRDAMAEMAERAQLISQEAGTKIAAAMKDVIGAAAGIAGFAVESARDLVQYMVRRGQMTQDEADKLIREAEEAHGRKGGSDRGRAPTAKQPLERSAQKAEAPREAVRREPAKPSANASATKRPSGADATAKPARKPAAKRAPEKKAGAKRTTPKKRR
jgi:polyhydroxyalkanoate synthesis regulator phasin